MKDYITLESKEVIEILEILEQTEKELIANDNLRDNETYLTSDQVCELLKINLRTLQNYRDNKIIPFTQIGRKTLYPLKEIKGIMEKNLKRAR